jgi:hypothetical protein
MVEFLDNYLTKQGYIKAGDLTVEHLDRSKTERCREAIGVGSCGVRESIEVVLWELPVLLSGGVAIYIEYEYTGDAKKYTIADPYCEIEITGEGDNVIIKLFELKGSCWYV